MLSLGVLLSLSCGDNRASVDDIICSEYRKEYSQRATRLDDILFVIDNSPSMDEDAGRLAENMEVFATVLQNIEGGIPNAHIAVVSSANPEATLGQFSNGLPADGCPSGAFLSDMAYQKGPREKNYDGTLAEALACMAAAAPRGLALEQPLEAIKRALDGTVETNAGFLREGAFLFVVIIGDEDDCSGGAALLTDTDETNSAWRCFADSVQCDEPVNATGVKTACEPRSSPTTLASVDSYVDFLRQLKPNPAALMVAAISASGPIEVVNSPDGLQLASTCPGALSAQPTVRLDGFRSQFPNRQSSEDICTTNWADALSVFADRLAISLGNGCMTGDIDLDQDQDGVQHECTVSQITLLNQDGQEETLMPECETIPPDDNDPPCWYVDDNSEICEYSGEVELMVHWGRQLIPSVTVRALCHGGCVVP